MSVEKTVVEWAVRKDDKMVELLAVTMVEMKAVLKVAAMVVSMVAL